MNIGVGRRHWGVEEEVLVALRRLIRAAQVTAKKLARGTEADALEGYGCARRCAAAGGGFDPSGGGSSETRRTEET